MIMSSREIFTDRMQGLGLLVPTLIISIVFLYYPATRAVSLSFYQATFGRSSFTGVNNYIRIVTSSDYLGSIVISVGFAVCIVFGVLVVALYFTFLIHEVDYGKSVYLIASIWPYALPPAVAGLVFLFLSHPTIGILTSYIESIGVQVDWFSDGGQAFTVVVIAAIWKQIGYNIIFMTAAMSNIPDSLTETARIDGVGRINRLFRVYVPMMSPTLMFLLVINTIYGFFGTFAIIDTMTMGGPAGATNILIYDLYQTAFQSYDFGFASAKSVILFIVVGILMIVQFKISDRYTFYGT
uniref:sn-glycerol-3-phosphate transport system permease protein UgpA n=1 Tax=uncultured haloarchaeon TaxID=160804 RepID=A5YST5_9EURY|nr:ABC transporter permease protein [uncultured haloarchaeon]